MFAILKLSWDPGEGRKKSTILSKGGCIADLLKSVVPYWVLDVPLAFKPKPKKEPWLRKARTWGSMLARKESRVLNAVPV